MKKLVLLKEILSLIIVGFLISTLLLGNSPFLLAQELVKSPPKSASSSNVISLDFQDVNLKDVLKIFSQQSGLNFVASEVVRDKKVTLYLDKVSIQDALNNIIDANQLAYKQAEGSNIFIVNEKPKESEIPTITKVYVLKFARLSSSILQSSNSGLSGITSSLSGTLSALGLGTGGGGVSAGGGGTGTSNKGIDKIVEKLLSPQGSLTVDERTNSLIITDIPSKFERIEAIISQLDVPTPQILIEAEILEVNKDTVDKLGIEFGGTNGTVFSASGAGTSEAFPFAERARAIDATTSSVNLGTLSFNSLTAVMEALSTKSDTKILARPRIITLNNESAVINVTAQTAVASLTQTTTAEGTAVSSADTPERLTTGILLAITPQINDDGYITMLVAPEVTIPIASDFFPTKFVDPQTRSTRSIIRVKDGDTLVIAGLLKEEVSKVRRKVPILGDIPILGLLFNKMVDTIKNKELIVFITPHIIYDEKTPKPKKEIAKVVLSKKIEAAPLIPKPEKQVVGPKETAIPKPEKQVVAPKETTPLKAIDPKSREEAMERALDQLSRNNKRIPNGKSKPTDQI